MIDYEYQELFEQNSVRKEWRIQVFNGDILESVITNAELHADSIKLCQPLCTESMLTYGTCEASYIKFTVVSSVGQLKGKKLIVLFRFSSETETEYLQVGEFYVDSDELSDDRKSRDITAYDKIQTIINSDIVEWYSECGLPLNLKDFRDSFFEYFDLEQEDVELVNDDMVITETALPETISGLDVLQAICSGNGCLGRINNEGKFKYVFLNEPDTKNYGRNYKQGTLVYEDYEVKPITALRIYSNNDMAIAAGSADPARAAMVLDILKCDTYINHLWILGVEGEHYTVNDAGEYTETDKAGDFAAYAISASWAIKNGDLKEAGGDPRATEVTDSWEERVVSNPTVTFVFDDSNVADYKAAVGTVLKDYVPMLELGLVDDVDATIEKMIKECYDSGLQNVLDEFDAQYEAWKATR